MLEIDEGLPPSDIAGIGGSAFGGREGAGLRFGCIEHPLELTTFVDTSFELLVSQEM